MISAFFGLLLLVGFVGLSIGTVRSALTGRLEPFGRISDLTGKPPLLRSEQPLRFWLLWFSLALVSLIPLLSILVALTLPLFFAGK